MQGGAGRRAASGGRRAAEGNGIQLVEKCWQGERIFFLSSPKYFFNNIKSRK